MGKLVKDFEEIIGNNQKRYNEFSFMVSFLKSSTKDGVTNQA